MDWASWINMYEKELLNSVIPFWETHCIDKKYGGFFTFLDRDGSIYNADKFMWMQWRIVYMFATLYMTRYKQENWLTISENGFKFLTTHGKDENNWYYFGLNREGTPIVAPYNVFSEAFVVMGSAALFKATERDLYREETLSAMNSYLSRVDNPKGKWNKVLPGQKTRLNLGYYMIMANLGTVLKHCLNITKYDSQVANAIKMIMNHFWNEKYDMIFENINSDFSLDLDSCDGRHLNPGHGLEGMWFVLEYAETNNRPDLIPPACNAIKSIMNQSWDDKYGGIYYFMDVLGKPHLELQWDMKLWWVHNEALIASLYAYKCTKDEIFLDWFQKIHDWSWEHFRDPNAEWFGYLNRRGEPTHSLKGGKWKTFFHLPRYLLQCITLMKILNNE